jgi:SPP1 family predicted phage head-tail adaptor
MSGRFNRQITITRPVISKDASTGAQKRTYEPLVPTGASPDPGERFWAKVRDVPPSRSEAVRQGLQTARNQTVIRIRWRDDVTSDMRVTLHGDSDVVYEIVGGPAEVGGNKRFIEIVCERYSPVGS